MLLIVGVNSTRGRDAWLEQLPRKMSPDSYRLCSTWISGGFSGSSESEYKTNNKFIFKFKMYFLFFQAVRFCTFCLVK